jgi:hypothetical protein
VRVVFMAAQYVETALDRARDFPCGNRDGAAAAFGPPERDDKKPPRA